MQGHYTIGFNKASSLTPLIICSSSLAVITFRRKLYSPAPQAARKDLQTEEERTEHTHSFGNMEDLAVGVNSF